MKRPKKKTVRRTIPVGTEVFDAEEEKQLQFSKCFKFSVVDLDKPCGQFEVVEPISIPPGTPEWITDELIRHTIKTWQPYSEQEIDSDTAAAILINMGELLDVPIEQALDNNSRQGGLS